MSLLFIDGFEHYTTAQMLHKWDEQNSTTRHNIGTAYGRFGQGIQFHANSGAGYGRKVLPVNASTLIVGAAHRVTATENGLTEPIIAFMEGTSYHVEVRYSTDGKLRVTRNGTLLAEGTTVISGGLWRYIEFKATIHDTTGSFELRINGSIELQVNNVDTRNGGAGVVNKVHLGLGGTADGGHATQFDDFYVCDDQGAENNDFLGDVKVETLRPEGAGNYAQFTPSAGANFENVDDTTSDEDSTYNASATVGHRDSFAMTDVSTVAGTVKGMQHLVRARKDDAGAREVRPFLRIGGTDYDGGIVNLLDSYVLDRVMQETNPATGAAWTLADLAALEVGYKVES